MSSRSDSCVPMLQTRLTLLCIAHNIRTYPSCRMKRGPGPFAQLIVYLWPLEGLVVGLRATPPSGGDVLAVFAGLSWDVKWEVNGGSGASPEFTHCNWEDSGVCRHIRGYPPETVTSSCLQWWEGAGWSGYIQLAASVINAEQGILSRNIRSQDEGSLEGNDSGAVVNLIMYCLHSLYLYKYDTS